MSLHVLVFLLLLSQLPSRDTLGRFWGLCQGPVPGWHLAAVWTQPWITAGSWFRKWLPWKLGMSTVSVLVWGAAPSSPALGGVRASLLGPAKARQLFLCGVEEKLHGFCHLLSETGRMWAQPWHSLSGDCARPDSVSPGVRVIAGHIFLLHVNPKCCACKNLVWQNFPRMSWFSSGNRLFLENSVLGCGLIYKLFNSMNNIEENTEYSWKSVLIHVVASWSCSSFCSELTVSIHS